MIVVKESKLPLIVGIISSIIFTLFLIFSLLTSIFNKDWFTIIFCTITFGSLDSLAIYLILDYHNRKLILYEDHFTYTTFLGNTISYLYSQIQHIEESYTTSTNYKIISHNGKKIASFEDNMLNSILAISFLKEQGILFCPSEHHF